MRASFFVGCGLCAVIVALAMFAGSRASRAAAIPPPSPLPSGAWTNWFPSFAGNHPLPAHPRLHPRSQEMISLLALDSPNISGPDINDAQSTFYDAKATDPTRVVHCKELWGPAPLHVCALEGKSIHVPAGAVSANNTDHHVSIVEPDGCTVDDFWVAPDLSSPMINAEFAAQVNRCNGDGFVAGGGAGAAAGDGSLRLGRSPLAELRTGAIHHALEAAPACNNGGPPLKVGQATGGSSFRCKLPGPGIPMGAYLWSDITPDALPASLDPATRMICVALNRYGAVVNDSNGGYNGVSINALWNGTSDPAYAAWAHANMHDDATDPGACFPNRDWVHHLHVLAW